jgi:hypothetical protein
VLRSVMNMDEYFCVTEKVIKWYVQKLWHLIGFKLALYTKLSMDKELD